MTEIKQIVRVLNTDLDGNKSLCKGLTKIKGIGFNFSHIICNVLELDKKRKVGTLSQEEIKEIESLVNSPKRLPVWVLNRRKDYDTGENLHLITSKLKLTKEFDIKRMKKNKSYKGLRHAAGLTVRGQKTKSHFRKGSSVGVQKKKLKPTKKQAPTGEKK